MDSSDSSVKVSKEEEKKTSKLHITPLKIDPSYIRKEEWKVLETPINVKTEDTPS